MPKPMRNDMSRPVTGRLKERANSMMITTPGTRNHSDGQGKGQYPFAIDGHVGIIAFGFGPGPFSTRKHASEQQDEPDDNEKTVTYELDFIGGGFKGCKKGRLDE